jgi:hypothetical protein
MSIVPQGSPCRRRFSAVGMRISGRRKNKELESHCNRFAIGRYGLLDPEEPQKWES